MTSTRERPVEEALREEVADMTEDHDRRMAELEDQIAHDKSVHEHIIAVLSEGRCEYEALNDGLEQTIREREERIADLLNILHTCEQTITAVCEGEPTSTDWVNVRAARHLARHLLDGGSLAREDDDGN